MRKLSALVVLLTVVYAAPVFGDVLEVPSKISAVTVYPGAAHLTRTLTIELPIGDHTIIFDKITPPLDENTLSVSGEGTAAVKIFGGYIKQEFLKQAPDERIKELNQKIRDINDQIIEENMAVQVLDEKKEYLNSIKVFSGNQLPKDLVTTMPSIENLKGVGNFLIEEFAEIKKQKNVIRIKLRDLNEQLGVLNAQLNAVAGNFNNVQRRLAVDIGCTKPGKFTLHVAYLVNGANWRPLYDARTDLAKSAVELTSFGVITQRTGEDWQDVQLTLSTARPNIGGRMPYVGPWILQPFAPPVPQRGAFRKMMTLKSSVGAIGEQYAVMDGAAADASENAVVHEVAAPAAMAFSDVQQKGLSVTFKIPRPVMVKSDGTENKFPIATQALKSDFQYSSFPKAAALSYLNSDVHNSDSLQLLGGELNLFLEGDFVGKSNIENVSPGEKFSLYLGVNENVKVKREQVSKKVDDTMIMGIASSNKTTTVKIKITVENYEARAIKYNLFESMPVAENDKVIKAKVVDVSLEPAKKDWEDRKGVWQWVFDLAPKEKKEITYTYVVEHPRDMQVGGI